MRLLRKLPIHVLLIIGAFTMILPFFWMVTTSLKTPQEIFRFPPTWVPEKPILANYV